MLISVLSGRNEYAKIKKKCKYRYHLNESDIISRLSKTNPNEFWEYIKRNKSSLGKSSSNGSDINLDDFATYFEGLSNGTDLNFVPQDDLPENNVDIGIDELDSPFTEEELGKTTSTLIRNKSCGIDNIVTDFFIDAKYFMVPYLVSIFNRIFDTGIYPEAWNKGVIVPIFTKER